MAVRLVYDLEEVSFGNEGGEKGDRVNKGGRVSRGRRKKSVVLLLQITWTNSKRMPEPKGISSRQCRWRKYEEGEVNLNVQEEDVDDYGDVGNLLFLQAMILQKGERNTIDTGWIILDNQSIDDIFSNNWIAKDIHHSWGRYI